MSRYCRRALYAFSASFCFLGASSAESPLHVPFNTSATVGPDGPWNFLTLSVGTGPASNVSFLPSIDDPFSILVDASNCNNSSLCVRDSVDYYNASSSGATSNPYNLTRHWEDAKALIDRDNVVQLTGQGYYWMDTFHDPFNYQNITSFITKNMTATVGKKQYKPISALALEHADWGNKIGGSAGDPPTAWTLEYATWQAEKPTGGPLSFGMHIGAAAFGQTGSLYFGGYDRSRIIEPAFQTEIDNFGPIQIDSLAFGVSSGRAPWKDAASVPNNFVSFPPGQKKVNVTIQPAYSYISLPNSWTDEIVKHLPVWKDNDTNLYIWNTSDPTYHDIMSSLSYLNISFVGSVTSSIIRVPFATLNLTLEPPLSSKPVPYLPLYPREDAILFGRAFLQSAYFSQCAPSVKGYSYLAQAPGPSVKKSTTVQPAMYDEVNPVPATSTNTAKWEDTWAGILKPLDDGTENGSSASQTSSGSSSHLSGGGIAGIVIGVLAAVTLAAFAAWYLMARRKRLSSQSHSQSQPTARLAPPKELGHFLSSSTLFSSSSEKVTVGRPNPTPAPGAHLIDSRQVLLGANGTVISELDGGINAPEKDVTARYEMPATSRPAELPEDRPPPVPPKD